MEPLPLAWLPCVASVGKDTLVLMCQGRLVWADEGSSSSLRRRGGRKGRRVVGVLYWEERREGAVIRT